MVRAILVGLLTVSAAAACKGGGEGAPKVEPGATVGKVVELAGTVTATRGDQTRTLDPTSTVSGDDVITTQGDGRVTILLAHNNARWDLGPNKHERVADSLAWGLARADQPATAVDESTTAAGRHAERSAATGEAAATTDTRKKSDDKPPAVTGSPAAGGEGGGAPAETQPPPPPISPPANKGGAPGGGAPPPAKPTPPQAPRPKVTSATVNIQGKAPALQPRAMDEVMQTGASTSGDTGAATTRAPVTSQKSEKSKVEDVADPLQTAIERERAALHACVVAAGVDKVALVFHVAKGKTTIEVAGGTDKDRACFAKIAARIELPADQTTTYPLSVVK